MKEKKLLVNLSVFLLSIFVITYIIVQLVSTLTTDVEYQYVSVQNVENTLEADGYLVRSESVLFAHEEGVLTYSASESQKLGANQLVATVYSNSHGVDIQKKIQKLSEKIAVLEKSSVDGGYQTSDVSKIDAKIFDSLVMIKSSVTNNNIHMSEQYQNDVLISFNKRHLITSNSKDFSELVDKLQAEKNELTSSLQSPLNSIYSREAGYFSTLLDGYETVFTKDAIKNLTIDSFHSLIQAEKVDYSSLAVGKIITDFEWYTLCEVSAKEAEELEVGKNYSVIYLFSSDQKINALLEKKISQTDIDTVVLVMKIEEVPQNFDYTRNQTIRIIKDSTEGIGFPRSALRVVDGQQGVYVISGNSVGFKKVEIVSSTGSMYFSREFAAGEEGAKSHLTRFDRVITEGKDLYVGKILD